MSYKPFRNEDSLSELISESNDFLIIKEKLCVYRNDYANFLIWLTKGLKINRRACIIFIRQNFSIFNSDIQVLISQYIKDKGRMEDYK